MPPAARLHGPRRRPQEVEGARQVGLDHLPPLLAGELVDRREDADPGVVDQAVEAAVGCHHAGHEGVDLLLAADIHGPAGDPLAKFLRELAPAVATDSGLRLQKRTVQPASSNPSTRRAADPAAAAGDDRDPGCRWCFGSVRHHSTSLE